VAETLSDKDGKFDLPGCYSPFVDEPDITIYKKGYVVWSSRWIFPDRRNRTNYKWSPGIFNLEVFKREFTHNEHMDFIRSSINSAMNLESKKQIYDAFRWEDHLAFEERQRLTK
jgi:hypothetical protein